MKRWIPLAAVLIGCAPAESELFAVGVPLDAASEPTTADAATEVAPEAAPEAGPEAGADAIDEPDAYIEAGPDAPETEPPCPANMTPDDDVANCYTGEITTDAFNAWLPAYQTPDGGTCLAIWAGPGDIALVPECQALAYCEAIGAHVCGIADWTAACQPWSHEHNLDGGVEWTDGMLGDWSTCNIPKPAEPGDKAAIRCCKAWWTW